MIFILYPVVLSYGQGRGRGRVSTKALTEVPGQASPNHVFILVHVLLSCSSKFIQLEMSSLDTFLFLYIDTEFS